MIVIDGISLQINSFELFQWHKLFYVFPVVYLVIIKLKEKKGQPSLTRKFTGQESYHQDIITLSEKVLGL